MVLSFSCLIIIKKICLFFAPSSLYISFPLVWIYILKSEEEERKEGRNIYIRGQRGKSAKAIKHSIAIMAPLSSGHRQPEKGGPFERERETFSLSVYKFLLSSSESPYPMRSYGHEDESIQSIEKRDIDMYSTRCRKRNNFLFGRHLTI